jgi:AcrR family transcriptional regulator
MGAMKRDPAGTHARILDAAYALFYRHGFQRTSLDDIAAKAGVTKRTLYYHFRSKDALAGAMLAHQHVFVLAQIERWIGAPARRPGRAAAAQLTDRLFAALEDWASRGAKGRGHWSGSGFTRMAMELADLPGHPARVATRRHKAEVEAALAARLAACGAPRSRETARQVQMLLEGAMTLMLIHGDTSYARLAAVAARKVL